MTLRDQLEPAAGLGIATTMGGSVKAGARVKSAWAPKGSGQRNRWRNHLRYACHDRDSDSKARLYVGLKTPLLTRQRTFYLTCCFEWVLGARVQDQFILFPFVIAISLGLNGGWWLRVDFLIALWLGDLFTQVLGQLLMLLSLML